MNVIDLLTEDHREANELFRRFQLAEAPETLDEVAKEIVHELSVHAAVEEQFFYPLVRACLPEGSETADHAIEEHAEVKALLSDIEDLDAGTTKHTESMMKTIDSVRHHIEDEEGSVFPALREQAENETLETVGDIVEKAKKVVPTHPHPMVPGNATAQLVAGPWAALVDRARDLVSR